jgi:hypothetical protein
MPGSQGNVFPTVKEYCTVREILICGPLRGSSVVGTVRLGSAVANRSKISRKLNHSSMIDRRPTACIS